ncbi:hypothetical protein LTR91_003137 [Friedmanniomyces endolithicus]|uniref:Major facilitator superfamily (MFS) profile domain-containing protein n=1 Tax=Friedmanniomyces endolithicus TaxID=329885 RepID=A0AAN6R008_9PEZI|nr:hypothetical protein LTS00_015998 [Friedmanniomyces endolithicus]KAK0274245.1 hypothetical protein LTR35_011754 [Friedmanniomyces endolithicus]KAK0302670.1 hypothetical protein LTR01_008585 [Friedmanniomyces endolithicus]KAK0311774.1 hypothetical protein LTR82_014146 [Friedmanniomyces endolithicus]KAK0823423.1 hypothetical protein LTR73_008515 [Friedmanniomyces endolithicus]
MTLVGETLPPDPRVSDLYHVHTNQPPPLPTDKGIRSEKPSEEAMQTRLERLGRERPPVFTIWWRESIFVFSIAMSQLLTEFFVSGFTVILPTLITELDIPRASSVWPATAFSLAIAGTLLVFGRLGDMWGGYQVFLGGLVWLLIWSIIAGFSINPLMLDFCRALQGLGAAAFLPTGIMLMGSLYRPGPRKNLVFAIYGTSAVLGFFGGIFVAGIVGQYLSWGWYFWIGAILTAITIATSALSVPRSRPERSRLCAAVKMDYPGALAIITGPTLIVVAITQSAHTAAAWRTPYIPIIFSLGMLALIAFAYIETYSATHPLLPSSIWKGSAMLPLCVAICLLYGTWGIFSVYGTLYFQNVMSVSPLQVVAWYAPLGIAGLLLSIAEGFILHLVPGRILLIISGLGATGSQLLLALMPLEKANYWAWVFPATIMSTIGIDLATILLTVFVTTTFPAAQQGLAGAVVNSVLQLGVALTVGLTDIIQSKKVSEVGLARSYKCTFWFGVGAGALSLAIMIVWGKVAKATSGLTADEKAELLQEAEQCQEPRPG